jgi:hypothetical protein
VSIDEAFFIDRRHLLGLLIRCMRGFPVLLGINCRQILHVRYGVVSYVRHLLAVIAMNGMISVHLLLFGGWMYIEFG